MSAKYVHTCIRVRDPEASVRFYSALGFEPRGRLNFATAYNLYMGLPGDGDVLELTVNVGHDEPYDLGTGYNHVASSVDDIHAALAALGRFGVPPARPPARAPRAARRPAREAALPPGRPRRAPADRVRRRPGWLPDPADRGSLQPPAGSGRLGTCARSRRRASTTSRSWARTGRPRSISGRACSACRSCSSSPTSTGRRRATCTSTRATGA